MGKLARMRDGLKFLEPDSAPTGQAKYPLTSSVQACHLAPYTVWRNSAYSAGQDLKL